MQDNISRTHIQHQTTGFKKDDNIVYRNKFGGTIYRATKSSYGDTGLVTVSQFLASRDSIGQSPVTRPVFPPPRRDVCHADFVY